MRRVALAILLCLSACDDDAAPSGGTGGAGDESSSTSGDDGSTSEDESSGEESGSSGGATWDGETISVRSLDLEADAACGFACGASACLDARVGEGVAVRCNEQASSCMCGDDPEAAGTAPTHAVSECYLDPNAATSGFSMTRPDPLPYESCDEFCGEHNLGACAWTHWVAGEDGCFDWGADGGIRQYGEEMTIRTPFEDGEGGRLRFVCEI